VTTQKTSVKLTSQSLPSTLSAPPSRPSLEGIEGVSLACLRREGMSSSRTKDFWYTSLPTSKRLSSTCTLNVRATCRNAFLKPNSCFPTTFSRNYHTSLSSSALVIFSSSTTRLDTTISLRLFFSFSSVSRQWFFQEFLSLRAWLNYFCKLFTSETKFSFSALNDDTSSSSSST